jgi:hypothetical protein
MEVTKSLKPSDSGSRIGNRASVQAAQLMTSGGRKTPEYEISPPHIAPHARIVGRGLG